MQPVPIVYIAGSAHSGSTLLDLLISSHAEVVGAGELKVLSRSVTARRQGREHGTRQPLERRCACGARVGACPFWQAVDGILRQRYNLTLGGLDLDHPEPAEFDRQNRAIFASLRETARARYVVDLSKNPRRLARLLGAAWAEVHPLWLVRSPHGVVYSSMKKQRNLFTAAGLYVRTNLRIRSVLRGADYRVVRYESIATNPQGGLRAIMDWLDLAYQPSQLRWADPSQSHHHLAGNRLRHAGRRGADSSIRQDEEWRIRLSPAQRFCISLLTFPAKLSCPTRR